VHVFAEGPHAGKGFGTQAWFSEKADKILNMIFFIRQSVQ